MEQNRMEKTQIPGAVVDGTTKRVVSIPELSGDREDRIKNDNNEFNTVIESEFWRKIVLEAVHSGYGVEDSKDYADQLLEEYRKRNININD